ncbi:MAG TPA: hypothetical protein VNW92_24100 [Polyangiaceae bacterium]|jgi:hypothetical protein|nr:hypothetical protein [Polyangiaceae bacterium]
MGGVSGGGTGGQGGAEAGEAGAPEAGAPATGDGGAGGDSGDGSGFIANGPYAIAYTSLPGTDSNQRASVTATFANTGELTGYVYSAGAEDPTIGTNVASEVYMDSSSALGRWSGGTAGGHYFSSQLTWTANQGLHYAIGVPTPPALLPTSGTTSYSLLAATHPTVYPNTLAPGTVTGGSAKVAWGVSYSTISLTLSVTTTAGDYSIATTGTNDASTSVVEPDSWGGTAPATGTGPACAGSNCQGRFQGFIAGSAGKRVGCEFIITSSGTAYTVRGALLFGKP